MTRWPCPHCGLTWALDVPWCDCGYVWPGLPDVYVGGVRVHRLEVVDDEDTHRGECGSGKG